MLVGAVNMIEGAVRSTVKNMICVLFTLCALSFVYTLMFCNPSVMRSIFTSRFQLPDTLEGVALNICEPLLNTNVTELTPFASSTVALNDCVAALILLQLAFNILTAGIVLSMVTEIFTELL